MQENSIIGAGLSPDLLKRDEKPQEAESFLTTVRFRTIIIRYEIVLLSVFEKYFMQDVQTAWVFFQKRSGKGG